MNRIAWDKVRHAVMLGRVLGPSATCKWYPCHFYGQDCTWCFCPFYPCNDPGTTGKLVRRDNGKGLIWSCMNCSWIHRRKIADRTLSALLKEHGKERLNSSRLIQLRREILRGY